MNESNDRERLLHLQSLIILTAIEFSSKIMSTIVHLISKQIWHIFAWLSSNKTKSPQQYLILFEMRPVHVTNDICFHVNTYGPPMHTAIKIRNGISLSFAPFNHHTRPYFDYNLTRPAAIYKMDFLVGHQRCWMFSLTQWWN